MRLGASIERAHDRASTASNDTAAMDAALASRAFWKELCESVGDLMFETDRQGRFTFVAPNNVLGYDAHGLIGHLAADLLGAASTSGTHGFNPFASPRALRMHHAWLRRRDGSVALFAVSGHPISSGGMRGVAVDVTQADDAARQSAEAALSQAMVDRIVDRLRDEVLAPRMARAGLSELVHCLGAVGAAIAVMPHLSGPDAEARDQPPALAAVYEVGSGWEEFAPRLQAFLEAELLPDGATRSLRTDGVHLLVCSHRNRFGSPAALVLWRRADQPDWRESDRVVTA